MAQKLWEKNVQVNAEIDRFTVGRDREMDLYLAKHDVMGSMAHITMLESIGLLTSDELASLLEELKNIYSMAERGEFVIEEGSTYYSVIDKLDMEQKALEAIRTRNPNVLEQIGSELQDDMDIAMKVADFTIVWEGAVEYTISSMNNIKLGLLDKKKKFDNDKNKKNVKISKKNKKD